MTKFPRLHHFGLRDYTGWHAFGMTTPKLRAMVPDRGFSSHLHQRLAVPPLSGEPAVPGFWASENICRFRATRRSASASDVAAGHTISMVGSKVGVWGRQTTKGGNHDKGAADPDGAKE
jgi:hypothetical protein